MSARRAMRRPAAAPADEIDDQAPAGLVGTAADHPRPSPSAAACSSRYCVVRTSCPLGSGWACRCRRTRTISPNRRSTAASICSAQAGGAGRAGGAGGEVVRVAEDKVADTL